MNKILVTGASGFVGTNLLTYLSNQNEFNLESISLRKGVPAKIEDSIFAIIHLAGKAHDLKNISNEAEYFQVNTELTKELFQVFLLSKASIFIFLSSVKAVAEKLEGILTEEAIPNPRNAYGKSKLEAERHILSQIVPDWKKVFILRPCMIHGPGNKGNLNLIYKLVKIGFPWPLGSFTNNRSFCTIENLCFVINELLKREDLQSNVYNIADDEPISTNDLIRIIAKTTKKKMSILFLPKSIIYFISKLGDKFYLPLNTERLNKLTENYIVSNAKLLKEIGKPLPVNSKIGIIRTIKSINKNKNV